MRVVDEFFVSDIVELTVDANTDLVGQSVIFVAVTGSMPVNPDDRPPRRPTAGTEQRL